MIIHITKLSLYRPANYITSQQIIIALNDEAQAPAVQLGWWQMTGSQSGGAFAIDNVLIGSSAANAKSTYSDTYVACLKLAIELAVVHFSIACY